MSRHRAIKVKPMPALSSPQTFALGFLVCLIMCAILSGH